jgi:alpha-galactosidase
MVKISIIGAGSAMFSMAFIRDLCLTRSLGGNTVELMDIDRERLEIVCGLAQRYKKEVKADIEFERTTNRREALKDADFVLCVGKVIDYDSMEAERRISECYGFYRGLGDRVCDYYGGVGAYYQLRLFLDLAKDMELICPDAWLIETANPVFEGTTLVTRETAIKTVGVCHGHLAVRDIIRTLCLDPQNSKSQAVGFNHCIWMTHFLHKGEDAYPLIDEWTEKKAERYWKSEEYLKGLPWDCEQMSPGAVDTYKTFGLFPIGDTVRAMSPSWHHTDQMTKTKWFGPTGGFDSETGWAMYLDRHSAKLKTMAELAQHPDLPVTGEFPPVTSGEQHIPIIDAIVNDRETLLQLNLPNEGSISGIPDDVVVEIPVVASAKGLQGINVGKLPSRLMQYAIRPRLRRMEQILQAYLERDRESLVLMNMEDPRAKSFDQTQALLDELLSQPWNAEAAKHYE